MTITFPALALSLRVWGPDRVWTSLFHGVSKYVIQCDKMQQTTSFSKIRNTIWWWWCLQWHQWIYIFILFVVDRVCLLAASSINTAGMQGRGVNALVFSWLCIGLCWLYLTQARGVDIVERRFSDYKCIFKLMSTAIAAPTFFLTLGIRIKKTGYKDIYIPFLRSFNHSLENEQSRALFLIHVE